MSKLSQSSRRLHKASTWALAACLITAGIGACNSEPITPKQPEPGEIIGATSIASRAELPACNPSRRSAVYYLTSEDRFVFCDGQEYRSLDVIGEPGAPGTSFLVDSVPADPQHCPNGGVTIVSGFDLDHDAALDPDEITSEEHVCNGADGEPGPEGPVGATGPKGDPGQDGADAQSPLVETEEASPEDCPNGGIVLRIGIDHDDDAMLDPSEVTMTKPICNGADGGDGSDGSDGLDSLISTTDATPDQCPAGGLLVQTGADSDGDGMLDADEVSGEKVVCNGRNGADGHNSLITTAAASAEECADGGIVIRVGLDDDADSILDPDEVDATEVVCNGGQPAGRGESCEPAGCQVGLVCSAGLCCDPATQETCNGLDDDCDGNVDDGLICGSCPPNFADCNGDPADGCEVDLSASLDHCGACGSACNLPNAARTCSNGQCVVQSCNLGFGNCNGVVADGCETNLRTSVNNCGACGSVCNLANANEACNNGQCAVQTCNAGFGNCNGVVADGCEINLNSDPNHCGTCSTVCNLPSANEFCVSGQCAVGSCSAGFANCDGSSPNGCEANLNTSLSHCGSCNHECNLPNASESCSSGDCILNSCNAGFANCDSLASNGCEHDFDSSPNTCENAASVGAAEGDALCGFLCPSNPLDSSAFFTQTGTTSKWFRARILEDSDCDASLNHRIELSVAPGTDYDLFVYSSCGVLAGSSTLGTGATDSVNFTVGDEFGSVDSQDYWIEVRYFSASSCTAWTLRAFGRTC